MDIRIPSIFIGEPNIRDILHEKQSYNDSLTTDNISLLLKQPWPVALVALSITYCQLYIVLYCIIQSNATTESYFNHLSILIHIQKII